MQQKHKRILLKVALYAIITLGLGIAYYVTLPALHPASFDFWISLTIVLAAYLLPLGLIRPVAKPPYTQNGPTSVELVGNKWLVLLICAPIAIWALLSLFSSTFFHAKAYASIIDVTEAVFKEDMPQVNSVTNIALMDTATAQIVGNRTLGSLSHVISQYQISYTYNQINYRYTPQKVANLEYADFFKWIGNRKNGIPGFVMVDPVNNTAEYKEFAEPMRYAESGYFGDDLMRAIRFAYPTKILGTPRFEIDDEMNPIYVVPCYSPKVAFVGALDVTEVILFDPVTGESEICPLAETPAYIDIVFDGYLASEKYNWKGTLSGGFWNSIIGNKDCKQTTDDFGYIVIGDDVWYYTGVTSVISDKSNIGFIISNARTGEYKFYSVVGAEEHSAMAAAEGEVQEKGYIASFPALINVADQPTYIMVLKADDGQVRRYALVNVEQYNLVATGSNQKEAITAYRELLAENGVIDEGAEQPPIGTTVSHTVTVSNLTVADMGDFSAIYFGAELDGVYTLFTASLPSDESLLLIRVGDKITFEVRSDEEAATPGILRIVSWSRA